MWILVDTVKHTLRVEKRDMEYLFQEVKFIPLRIIFGATYPVSVDYF